MNRQRRFYLLLLRISSIKENNTDAVCAQFFFDLVLISSDCLFWVFFFGGETESVINCRYEYKKKFTFSVLFCKAFH